MKIKIRVNIHSHMPYVHNQSHFVLNYAVCLVVQSSLLPEGLIYNKGLGLGLVRDGARECTTFFYSGVTKCDEYLCLCCFCSLL